MTSGGPGIAAARLQERAALSRYRALLVAARESLRLAEERFNTSSAAIEGHVRAALAALAGHRRSSAVLSQVPQR